jgi:hypothetical protein
MKKYLNGSNKCLCLEFGTHAQFLFRGQSITTDETPKSVPEGIVVHEIEEEKPKRRAPKKKAVSKKVEDNLGD